MKQKSPKPSKTCRRGHAKTGKNVIMRVRNGKKLLECRTCANEAMKARREARKRNAKLLKGEQHGCGSA